MKKNEKGSRKSSFGNSPGQKAKKGKKYTKTKKNEKGSRKSSFWQFPKSVLKAQKGKIANMRKKTKRVREKAPFGNSSGQF